MRFALDPEQRMFADSLRGMLSDADVPNAVRAWSHGDHGPGLALWSALGGTGAFALTVDEEHGGAGLLPVELVTAMVEFGRHAVPGPVVETAVAATVLADPDRLSAIAEGTLMATLAHPEAVPYALDADAADLALAWDGEVLREAVAGGPAPRSLDPARRLYTWASGAPTGYREPEEHPYDLGALACAAQALGVGEHLLATTVDYVSSREQFGRPVGGFQAVKHQLADVLTELSFARPLVYAAALSHGTPEFVRDVSAAKVAASEAAYAAARTALQLHGAIGYTDEYDLSLWIRKARALRSAWGDPARHRARLATVLTG